MRCQLAGRALASAAEDFPDIEVEKVGFFTNRARAREAGVTGFPTLVHGEAKLSGALLSKAKIRSFLEQL